MDINLESQQVTVKSHKVTLDSGDIIELLNQELKAQGVKNTIGPEVRNLSVAVHVPAGHYGDQDMEITDGMPVIITWETRE